MQPLLVIGAGKIGSLASLLLTNIGHYQVHVVDQDPKAIKRISEAAHLHAHTLDVSNEQALRKFCETHNITALVNCLPYYASFHMPIVAKECHLHYFDVSEDVALAKVVAQGAMAAKHAFIPSCGLAPGIVSIIAQDLISQFDSLETVRLRVGALPAHASNALHYALTWSTDGLINEYGNVGFGIKHGQLQELHPLEGLETLELDGLIYEAFNTSGGIGTLADTYAGKVQTMNYKTLRYPGHCEKMRFLMQDLKLNQDRQTLKRILENSLPKTQQDVVVIYVTVTGNRGGVFAEENYFKKIYPKTWLDQMWSAIQMATATSLCTIVDIVLQTPQLYQGLKRQEDFKFKDVLNNRFGKLCYAST